MRTHLTNALAVFAAVASLSLGACGSAKPTLNNEDITLGQATAPVELIEYASASCPHCAAFSEEAFPQIKAKYIDTGKVRYALREVILHDGDSYGQAGFMLARCAGRDKYYPVLDSVFRGQEAAAVTPMRDVLVQIAAAAGMSEAQFTACVSDAKAAEAFTANVNKNLKVLAHTAGTPAFFVNGVYITQPEHGTEAEYGVKVEAAIDAALAKAK